MGTGILCAILLHLVFVPLAEWLWLQRDPKVWIPVSLWLGAWQWAYLLPATAIAWYRGNSEVAKGIVLTGLIVMLANATCLW